MLQDLSYTISHVEGRLNVLPDFLSRLEHTQTRTAADDKIDSFPDIPISAPGYGNHTQIATMESQYDLTSPNTPFTLEEIEGDLFSASKTDALAYCIAADADMSSGIARLFRDRFGRVQKIKNQFKGPGQVAIVKHNKQYIYSLVTKVNSQDRPNYLDLARSLGEMRTHCLANGVTNVAIPRICSGPSGLPWKKVRQTICSVFAGSGITMTVFTLPERQTQWPAQSNHQGNASVVPIEDKYENPFCNNDSDIIEAVNHEPEIQTPDELCNEPNFKTKEMHKITAVTQSMSKNHQQSEVNKEKQPSKIQPNKADKKRQKYNAQLQATAQRAFDTISLTPDEIKHAQQSDKHCKQIYDFLQYGVLPKNDKVASSRMAWAVNYHVRTHGDLAEVTK